VSSLNIHELIQTQQRLAEIHQGGITPVAFAGGDVGFRLLAQESQRIGLVVGPMQPGECG
jgi:hypothetical protein